MMGASLAGCGNTTVNATQDAYQRALGKDNGGAEEYVHKCKNRFAPGKRPAKHPFDCDFRDALGLPHIAFTNNDVYKHARQANCWWHPDKRVQDGMDCEAAHESFLAFRQIVLVLKDTRLRKSYIEEVELEHTMVKEDRGKMEWRKFNTRFMRRGADKQRLIATGGFLPGSMVTVHGLRKRTDLNGLTGMCLSFVDGRWQVRLSPNDEVKAILSDNLEMTEPIDKTSLCHVFLDGSGSMRGENGKKGKQVLKDLFPSLTLTPTAIHLIGNAKTGSNKSRCLYNHMVDLEHKETAVIDSWTTVSSSTFLWQYVYEQVKDFAELRHEVIIITDGGDNASGSAFRGLAGFNELMQRMGGSKIRISLFLIGSSLSSHDAAKYRDLCLATGGVYHHSAGGPYNHSLAAREFVGPLLLTEAERDKIAHLQQGEYLCLLSDGRATSFEWFRPLLDAPADLADASAAGHSGSGAAASGGQHLQFNPVQRVSARGANFSVTEVQ